MRRFRLPHRRLKSPTLPSTNYKAPLSLRRPATTADSLPTKPRDRAGLLCRLSAAAPALMRQPFDGSPINSLNHGLPQTAAAAAAAGSHGIISARAVAAAARLSGVEVYPRRLRGVKHSPIPFTVFVMFL